MGRLRTLTTKSEVFARSMVRRVRSVSALPATSSASRMGSGAGEPMRVVSTMEPVRWTVPGEGRTTSEFCEMVSWSERTEERGALRTIVSGNLISYLWRRGGERSERVMEGGRSMDGHGRSWTVMEGRGRSWTVMGGHGRSWRGEVIEERTLGRTVA